MKKRTFIRVVSFLCAAVLAAAGMYVKETFKSRKYRQIIENNYAGALDELTSSLNDISTNLVKISYVSSPKQLATYASEIYSQAQLAKGALYKLPTAENELSGVYKFLSQVGNYTIAVSKDVIGGKDVSDKQRDELKILSTAAKNITDVIEQTNIDCNNPEYWADELEGGIKHALGDNDLGSALGELQSTLSDYPTLIYDGPYSDHILNKKPLMTENAAAVSKEAALGTARKASGDKKLSFAGVQSGKIDCYRFTGGDTAVTVSKKGGYVVYMRKSRSIGRQNLSYGKMLSKAQDYLGGLGFENMVDTYYFTDSGICTVNFAYLDGQTVCYTDLIKVGVAVDTGEIMLFESSGYLTNHTLRAFEAVDTEPDAAKAVISKLLTVKGISMALIPTNGGGEVRCYEFSCENGDGGDIIVYVNVKSLEVEQIFILLKTDGGTLVK